MGCHNGLSFYSSSPSPALIEQDACDPLPFTYFLPDAPRILNTFATLCIYVFSFKNNQHNSNPPSF
jgi:hypothetical protein